jgi:hypothetical protein
MSSFSANWTDIIYCCFSLTMQVSRYDACMPPSKSLHTGCSWYLPFTSDTTNSAVEMVSLHNLRINQSCLLVTKGCCSEDWCCWCTGVQCGQTEDPPYFRCGACPPGSTGNGTSCHDLDEVRASVCCLLLRRVVNWECCLWGCNAVDSNSSLLNSQTNVINLLLDNTVTHPKRSYSTYAWLWGLQIQQVVTQDFSFLWCPLFLNNFRGSCSIKSKSEAIPITGCGGL